MCGPGSGFSVEFDYMSDDVVTDAVHRHQNQLDLAVGAAAVINADPPGVALLIVVFGEHRIEYIGREFFGMAKLHRVLETGTNAVEAVDRGSEVAGILPGEVNRNDVIAYAVLVVCLSFILTFVGVTARHAEENHEGEKS